MQNPPQKETLKSNIHIKHTRVGSSVDIQTHTHTHTHTHTAASQSVIAVLSHVSSGGALATGVTDLLSSTLK